jgi:hypothetical protein
MVGQGVSKPEFDSTAHPAIHAFFPERRLVRSFRLKPQPEYTRFLVHMVEEREYLTETTSSVLGE